jgi:hypothetical protein
MTATTYPTLCPPDARDLPWAEAAIEAHLAGVTLAYLHAHGRRSACPWRDAQLEAWGRCPPLPTEAEAPSPVVRRTLRNDDGTLWLIPKTDTVTGLRTRGPAGPAPAWSGAGVPLAAKPLRPQDRVGGKVARPRVPAKAKAITAEEARRLAAGTEGGRR